MWKSMPHLMIVSKMPHNEQFPAISLKCSKKKNKKFEIHVHVLSIFWFNNGAQKCWDSISTYFTDISSFHPLHNVSVKVSDHTCT